MKKILLLFIMSFSAAVYSQGIIPQGNATSVVKNPGGYWSEKWQKIPVTDDATATPNLPNAGKIRFNPTTGVFQVHNGAVWLDMSTSIDLGDYVKLDPSPTTEQTIQGSLLLPDGEITVEGDIQSDGGNIEAAFDVTAGGQVYIGSAAPTLAQHATRMDYVDGLDATNIKQGGNTFGSLMNIGTNDDFAFSLKRNSVTRFLLSGDDIVTSNIINLRTSDNSSVIAFNSNLMDFTKVLTAGTDPFFRFNSSGAATGDIVNFRDGTTLRAGVRKDGKIFGTDGTASNDYVTVTQLGAKVTDAIVNGVTTVAPSQNAVFDALALKSNIIGTFIVSTVDIPALSNLNTFTTTGAYLCQSNAIAAGGTNFPVGSAGKLEVIAHSSANTYYQTYHVFQGVNTIYYRACFGGTWSAWKLVGEVQNSMTASTTLAPSVTAVNTAIGVAGSFSGAGTATTTFTVTIGTTQANTTYKVTATPTNVLSAAPFYISNKTTTTFDVVYLSGLTGTVAFDWILRP